MLAKWAPDLLTDTSGYSDQLIASLLRDLTAWNGNGKFSRYKAQQ
jgi:hypothetical protein